jgi:PASTA domain/Bacterial Ig domain/Cadherin-like domain
MLPDRHPTKSSLRKAAITAAALVLGLLPGSSLRAQSAPPPLPQCVPPPNPFAADHWPRAGTDLLGSTTGPRTFSGATLLANDTGPSSLSIVMVGPATAKGGVITGSDPYVYTPAGTFTGDDSFPYVITDLEGETTMGIVRISVVLDAIAPTITLASPGSPVSGNVPLSATAADNVGVAGVKFFDGATLIGSEITSGAFSIVWNTTLVADGSHTLTAVARDAAGNTTTSNAVTVLVNNAPPPPPPAALTLAASASADGVGAITTAAIGITTPGTVLVALASSDGPPAGTNTQSLTISGGGLSWTRLQRAVTQRGDAEIWTATAAAPIASLSVTSTQAVATLNGVAVNQSLTVLAFTGSAGIGASSKASGASGAPRVSLVTQSAGSLVYGVGIDFDQAIARTVPAGQTKVHEYLAPSGDTMWMQALSAATGAAGSTATLNDTAPTADQWNFASVEIKSGTPPASVTVPNVVGLAQADAQAAITGAGLTVGTISNATSATVPAGQVISQTPSGGSSALAGSAVSLVVSSGAPAPGPVAQVTVSADGTGPQTTPAFSTSAPGEVLVALVASDGPTAGANNQFMTISGAGLTWTRVTRAAVQRGIAEIWTATAPTVLTNVTVTSTQSVTSVLGLPPNQSLTVIAFTGASGIGASNIASGATGAPRVSLVAQAGSSAIYGVGIDFDRAVARTVPAGQTKVHEFLAPSGDTMWMQMLNATTSGAGVTATLNDTAPTADQWNFAIVEIKR